MPEIGIVPEPAWSPCSFCGRLWAPGREGTRVFRDETDPYGNRLVCADKFNCPNIQEDDKNNAENP